jgi:hypothetical protein
MQMNADYRRSVALKYVKRGFHILISHSLTIIVLPLAALGVVGDRQNAISDPFQPV